MDAFDYLSISALIVSIISLGGTFYFNIRDRMKVQATSKLYASHPDYDKAHLEIKVVNIGRRIAVLTLFGGDLENGRWQGEALGESEKGLHLAEHEFYKYKFYKDDILAVSPDFESNYIELWFEDSLGRRHKVKDSKINVELLNAT